MKTITIAITLNIIGLLLIAKMISIMLAF